MNDFNADNVWQKKMRDTILLPGFYGKYAYQGRYVTIDKGRLATTLQKRYAVDTVVQGKDGNVVCIEEKIVRWPGYKYSCVCLETESCTVLGHESPGWMVYGEADYLLYCFETDAGNLDCWLMDFQALKKWFLPRERKWPPFKMRERNQTRGRVVPIDDIKIGGIKTHNILVQKPQADGHFVHYCHCGKLGLYGHGANLREGIDGTWYCAEHRARLDNPTNSSVAIERAGET